MTVLISELKQQHDQLQEVLLANEPSLAIGVSAVLTKSLVLAAASEIEVDFQDHLIAYFDEVTSSATPAVEFVTKKAVKRQFHTYFDWEGSSANQFFGLFGTDFKARASAALQADVSLADSMRAFLRLGALRNSVVHQNFGAFSLGETADEVFDLYVRARRFCDGLPALLRL